MLCIDNSEIASYFRQFGLGDMLEQDWVKTCIKATDESKRPLGKMIIQVSQNL